MGKASRSKNGGYYRFYGRLLTNRGARWRMAGVGMMAWQGPNCEEMDKVFKKIERFPGIAARYIR